MEYLFIYPESHAHIGLFRDLEGVPHVTCVVVRKKKYGNPVMRSVEKLYLSGTVNHFVNLPGKERFYGQEELESYFGKNFDMAKQYCVAVVDSALRGLSVEKLNNVFSRKNVRGVLLMINSLGADSTSMNEIRSLIPKVHWADVYTFDPVEQKKYGWKSIQNAYYSCPAVYNGKDISTDIYFAGGVKGDREALLLQIFRMLRANGVNAYFQIMTAGTRRLQRNVQEEGLVYFSGGWKPYSEILSQVQKTNVILEILQKGQHGPSLRYYEAVCYNKKLLTNNPGVRELPYYNPAYMKVISSPDDIDTAWIKKREKVEYAYQGDFSPVRLLEILR